jgi:hypothetical protein
MSSNPAENDTPQDAATEIVHHMSDNDRANFDRDEWREGVSNMQAGGWEHLDTGDILDAIEAMLQHAKLQAIADAMNAADTNKARQQGYIPWEHFEHLCAVHGLDIDYGRQDSEDPEGAFDLFVDGGWGLHVSCDKWHVSTPENA